MSSKVQLASGLLAVLALSKGSTAFKVDFYMNDNCSGEWLGEWVGGVDQGCQTLYAGQAGGAVITSTGSVDDNCVTSFYSSGDCNLSNAVATANGTCIGISDFANNYQSFDVICGEGDDSLYKRSDDLEERNKKDVKTQGKKSITFEDRHKLDDDTIKTHAMSRKHGELSEYEGKTFKWHQVAHGAWRGINPEDWDDKIHVKNDTKVDYSESFPIKFDHSKLNAREVTDIALWGSALDERSFIDSVCATGKQCAITAGKTIVFTVSAVSSAFVNKALQVSGTNNLWEFLNQPLVIACTIEFGSAAFGGAVGAWTSNTPTASGCSSQNSDADAISSLMVEQGSQLAALASAISDLAQTIGQLKVTAYQTGTAPTDITCGAPNPNPTNEKMKRRAIGFRG